LQEAAQAALQTAQVAATAEEAESAAKPKPAEGDAAGAATALFNGAKLLGSDIKGYAYARAYSYFFFPGRQTDNKA
jgi:hypothetical protein